MRASTATQREDFYPKPKYDRKPISRPIVVDQGVRTTRIAKRVRRAYDSSSDSSDDYAALGKKLTAKYKVDKINKSSTKYLKFHE